MEKTLQSVNRRLEMRVYEKEQVRNEKEELEQDLLDRPMKLIPKESLKKADAASDCRRYTAASEEAKAVLTITGTAPGQDRHHSSPSGSDRRQSCLKPH